MALVVTWRKAVGPSRSLYTVNTIRGRRGTSPDSPPSSPWHVIYFHVKLIRAGVF